MDKPNSAPTPKKRADKPHDKGYKRIFSRKRNFLHFLKKYVRSAELAEWIGSIDENELDFINTELIDKEFRKRESDILYKMKFKGREIIFYVLLELQSSTDFTMPFRLLRYIVLILNYIFENTPREERELKDYRLPAVAGVVLYNGGDNWTAVRSFREYSQGFEEFGRHIVDFEYYLCDVNRMESEELLRGDMCGARVSILDIVFFLDRKLSRENIGESAKTAWEHYRDMSEDDRRDLTEWMDYVWLSHIGDERFKEEIMKSFEKGDIESMNSGLTLAFRDERLKGREEGREEGVLKRSREMAHEMFADGKNISEIRKYSKLPEKELAAVLLDLPKDIQAKYGDIGKKTL